MKKLKYLQILVLSSALLVLIGSCTKSKSGSDSLYIPTGADVTSTATLPELQLGRTLYISNCNSCHGLYSPDDYTSTQWKGIISNMAPNTGMSASQILLVTKYVTRGN